MGLLCNQFKAINYLHLPTLGRQNATLSFTFQNIPKRIPVENEVTTLQIPYYYLCGVRREIEKKCMIQKRK